MSDQSDTYHSAAILIKYSTSAYNQYVYKGLTAKDRFALSLRRETVNGILTNSWYLWYIIRGNLIRISTGGAGRIYITYAYSYLHCALHGEPVLHFESLGTPPPQPSAIQENIPILPTKIMLVVHTLESQSSPSKAVNTLNHGNLLSNLNAFLTEGPAHKGTHSCVLTGYQHTKIKCAQSYIGGNFCRVHENLFLGS